MSGTLVKVPGAVRQIIQHNMEQRTNFINKPRDPKIGDPISFVRIKCKVMDKKKGNFSKKLKNGFLNLELL